MTSTQTETEIAPELAKKFTQMITVLPDFEPGDGSQILASLLEAKTLDDLNAPWGGGRAFPLNVPVDVTALYKAPSDFGAGLSHYIVADCVVVHSGEIKQYVSGATSVVAQLLMLHVNEQLPARVICVEPEKVSRNGYKPQHLVIESVSAPAKSAKNGK